MPSTDTGRRHSGYPDRAYRGVFIEISAGTGTASEINTDQPMSRDLKLSRPGCISRAKRDFHQISHDFDISASFLILGPHGSYCTGNVSQASSFENEKYFLESQDAR